MIAIYRVLLLIAGAHLLAGCATAKKDKLRAEIAQVRERVGQAQGRVEAQTSTIGSTTKGLETKVSYAPISSWTQTFNARPPAERTVSFRQTSNGKIARKDWDCGLLGDGGYYVEFDTSTSTRADLAIRSLTLRGGAGSMTLTAPMAFDFKTKLHGHLDPCPGGGKGWRPRVEAQKNWDTVVGLQFGTLINGKIPYTMRLLSPGELSITVQVHLGDIGTLGIPIKATGLARELGRGELSLLFDQEGTVGPLPDGQVRKYRVKTFDPVFSANGAGIALGADVVVEILPAAIPLTNIPGSD